MKKLTILLLAISTIATAQTTIPVKSYSKIPCKKNLTDSGYNVDLMFAIQQHPNITIFINKYCGKYYSPYPYKCVCRSGTLKVYDVSKDGKLIYTVPQKINHL